MIDKINRFFAAIVKANVGYYLFMTYILAMVFLKARGFPTNKIDLQNDFFTSSDLLWYSIIIFAICGPLYSLFYTAEETRLQKYTRLGVPQVDPFFYQKISSNIHPLKKLIGYGYAFFKFISYGSLGYAMAVGTLTVFCLKG